jgi:CDP-diacylglycerol--serine O-phosphatidyltransferase
MAAAGAYRLARFNIDDAQGVTGFKGVPIPAAGLLIASFPLIYWYSNSDKIIQILINKWFWYAVILIVSYLMVSTLPMLAFKFSSVTVKKILPFLGLAVLAVLAGMFFGWLAAPVTFIAYVLVSLLLKQSHT